MATNNPVIPAQPQAARYGVAELFTCPRLTRAIYQERFGEQAPAYDPKKQIKRWFFTDVLEGSTDPANELCEIQVWDSAKKVIRKMAMTKADAATPNLPGVIVWPKYVNAVTTMAVVIGPDGDRLAISGETLVDLTLAKSVVDEINAANFAPNFPIFKLVAASDPWPWKITWGLESRRRMNISDGTREFDAAAILRNRFARGVGSPGQWSLGPEGGPVFTPDVPIDGEQDVRPEVPMPCRALLPNEKFAEVTFGGLGGVIERTDLQPVGASSDATGGLTEEQDRRLRNIAIAVKAEVA